MQNYQTDLKKRIIFQLSSPSIHYYDLFFTFCEAQIYFCSLFNLGSSLRSTEPTQVPSSTRFQLDPAIEPEPTRYVNFLFYEGYSVEILGGKHFKTRDGEFVEVKSGTQYKILVKNSRTYGEGQIKRHMF